MKRVRVLAILLGGIAVLSAVVAACTFTKEEPEAIGTVHQAVLPALTLSLPAGFNPRGVAIGASSELKINDGAEVPGVVTSTGAVPTNFGVSSVVEGVVSYPDIVLRNFATVSGNLATGGNLTLNPGAVVSGTVSEGVDMAEPFEWNFTPAPGTSTGDVGIAPDTLHTLSPGTFGSLNLGSRATLTLTTGVYYFSSWAVQPQATVRIDHSAGPVLVIVAGTVTHSGAIETVGDPEPPQWVLVTSSDANIHTAFRGAIFAPGGKINLASSPSGHRGQFFARIVEVHQNQSLTYEPFEYWDALWDSTQAPSSPVPGLSMRDLFPDGEASDACLRFFEAAFENDDDAEYQAAKSALRNLPTSSVVASLQAAYDESPGATYSFPILFVAGVIHDATILPLYQKVFDTPVPPQLLVQDFDPHGIFPWKEMSALQQAIRNTGALARLGVPGAKELLLEVATQYAAKPIRGFAIFEIKRVAEVDPSILSALTSSLVPGDEDLLDVRQGTLEDLAIEPPPPEELELPDYIPRVPSSGGVLPSEDCHDEELNQDETDTDCGGAECDPCQVGASCSADRDCESRNCLEGSCGPSLSPGDCADLGSPGTNVTSPADGCFVVSSYPSWWEVRTMQVQTTTGGTYPTPFTWTSSCSGTGGSGVFTSDWQNQLLFPTNESCPTIINLAGPANGSVTVRYYGN